MIQKLSHATIYVLDQEQALDFYANKLGFEVRMDMTIDGGFRWLTVGPKTQPELELILFAVAPGGVFDEAAAGHLRALLETGLGMGVFNTDDCHATYTALQAKGVEFVSPPQEQPYGIEATFKDSFWKCIQSHAAPLASVVCAKAMALYKAFYRTKESTMNDTPGAELEALLAYLQAQREHVLGILEGLDDEVLRRAVLPSGWTCLGLVQHLAVDVERFWFRAVVAGEQAVINNLSDDANAWHVSADVSADTIFTTYQQEIACANTIIAATPLDAAPAWWPVELFGAWRLNTVREILLHVLTETACHTGHLDAARELIDGKQWLVLN